MNKLSQCFQVHHQRQLRVPEHLLALLLSEERELLSSDLYPISIGKYQSTRLSNLSRKVVNLSQREETPTNMSMCNLPVASSLESTSMLLEAKILLQHSTAFFMARINSLNSVQSTGYLWHRQTITQKIVESTKMRNNQN